MESQIRRISQEHRRSFIGGSDARVVMGRDETALFRLWREKRGEIEPADLSGELIVQLGLVTEELNRRWFERNTGHRLGSVQWDCAHAGYAARRFLGVRFVSAGRAARVRPRARITRITVLNSGLPVSLSALYRLSRFSSAVLATWLMPRALATRPSASRTKSALPVSSAAVM